VQRLIFRGRPLLAEARPRLCWPLDFKDIMENSLNRTYDARTTPPTAKERNSVQRSVNNLLDTLAPERATTRGDRAPVPVEQHRTPTGCVLQAATAALSVRWFADTSNDAQFGELQVVIWKGVVSRRGSSPTPDGASVVTEFALRPIDQTSEAAAWRASDGTTYDVAGLAEHCLSLLKTQMLVDDPTGSAQAHTPRRRD
jgi:hypothetical protein